MKYFILDKKQKCDDKYLLLVPKDGFMLYHNSQAL